MTTTGEISLEYIGRRLQELQQEATHNRLVADVILKQMKSLHAEFEAQRSRLDLVDHRLSTVDVRLDSMSVRLDSMDVRLGSMSERVGGMDVRLGSMSERVGSMDVRLGTLEVRMSERFGEVDGKLDRVLAKLEKD